MLMSILCLPGPAVQGSRSVEVAIGAPSGVVPAAAASPGPGKLADPAESPNLARLRAVTLALLLDHVATRVDIPQLEADVDELVRVWTPTLCARSRFELVSGLWAADDAIRDVVVTFAGGTTGGDTAMLEWVATGRFSDPLFLHDDVLVEPSGGIVRAAGASAATFRGTRATRIHCYFDRLALVEQLLHPSRAGPRSPVKA